MELTYETGYRDGTVSSAGMSANNLMAQRRRYENRLEGTPRRGGLRAYIEGTVDAYRDELASREPIPPARNLRQV